MRNCDDGESRRGGPPGRGARPSWAGRPNGVRTQWATGAPCPPWWREQPARVRREPLTRAAIVEAALSLLEDGGVEGLTMRRVAERLQASAGALYGHVTNKQQLLELLLDRVFEGVEIPPPDPDRWQEQMKDICRTLRDRLRSHGDLSRVMFARIPIGPNFIRLLEQQLAFCDEIGLPAKVAAYLGDLLGLYVAAFAFEESLWARDEENHAEGTPPGSGAAGAAATVEDETSVAPAGIDSVLQRIDTYLSALPADRFPNILARKDLLLGIGPEERFELGLDIILQGVATLRN